MLNTKFSPIKWFSSLLIPDYFALYIFTQPFIYITSKFYLPGHKYAFKISSQMCFSHFISLLDFWLDNSRENPAQVSD